MVRTYILGVEHQDSTVRSRGQALARGSLYRFIGVWQQESGIRPRRGERCGGAHIQPNPSCLYQSYLFNLFIRRPAKGGQGGRQVGTKAEMELCGGGGGMDCRTVQVWAGGRVGAGGRWEVGGRFTFICLYGCDTNFWLDEALP